MKDNFSIGDLLLYFNDNASYFVVLDEIDNDYFTIVTNQVGNYEYGFRIKIRHLTSRHFRKIETKFLRINGKWERWEIDKHLLPMAEIQRF